LVTCEYNDSVAGDPGMVWVILHDNPVLAWLVDETGTTPVVPVILGTSAVPPPDTGEIMSPPWAVKEGSTMFIPDMARGVPGEMFTFLAVNNGATRKLYANFANYELAVSWNDWARSNPSLALTSPPNVAPPPDAF
jgi:hypothetical protein